MSFLRRNVLSGFFITTSLLAGLGCSRSARSDAAAPEEVRTGDRTCGEAQPCVLEDPGSPAEKPEKRLWAYSRLYYETPKLEARTWLSQQPEFKDKFVLIVFWRTWCGACKQSVPLLNSLHEKYGNELVVLAITGESEETVKAYDGPEIKYFQALDTPRTTTEEDAAIKDQGAFEAYFGVWAWPHVVLLEPANRCVIWEGFPLLKGFELTAAEIDRVLAIDRENTKDKKS